MTTTCVELFPDMGDKSASVNAGDFIIIPCGVEHRPVAETEVQVMLFEPATTLNTGNLVNERTREDLEHI